MALLTSAPQAALAAAVLYVSWLILKPFVVKSPLDNIPGPPRNSWLSGNLAQYFAQDAWDFRAELARKYPRVAALHGMPGQSKWITVWDVKAMQNIFLKEQDIYAEPVFALRMMLGPGLLGTEGEQHKRQRKTLNPVFSVKHLRDMTPLFYQVIHKTRDAIMERVRAGAGAKGGVELDMLSWSGRTTLEVLGQAGLGHSFDPLTEDRPDEFADAVKDFFPQMARSLVLRLLMRGVANVGSAPFRRWVVERIPNDNVQQLKRISDIMHGRSIRIFNEKKEALEKGDETLKHQIGEGRDIMSILLRENMLAKAEDKLPDDELIGQISTMVLAGMDTTANSLARALQILAERQDVQEKLRQEILHAIETEGQDGTLDYEKIMELPYLEAVCRETLRLYPGVTSLFRETTKDVIMPLSEPIRLKDGTLTDAIPIPKGTRVVPNIGASNVDPALWGADAHEWRPERWLEPLPRAVEEARVPGVYSHLMTFIGGSKACIGFKFAQIEMKTVLLVLLQNFKFEPTGKPIKWNFAGVQYPSVGSEGPEPALPLLVSALRA
ncbi:cytochrome P450 [Dichomitus squalens LYAD-421 SS1]|uniref:cytochrome P450 n=1 Tax=Dichomitus squalens (strain LYAD-421) TaxID=732165 RepID=UPI0004414723|nr:cytochrome P450 [Dichomitus squalens LYAD-421 SS1]EJF63643.1 cytochrome P450 [Dichomitus squalens LYAD-421 SS1]